MKNRFFIATFVCSVAILSFAGAHSVLAQSACGNGFCPLAPIPNLTQGVQATSGGLASFFNNLYKYLIGLAAILAIIMIVWGGLEISTKDSISKQSDGRERITQAILGLVLVLLPVLVFSIINPSILNLSLDIPPLTTVYGGWNNGVPVPAVPTTSIGGCSVSGTLLQTATCPTSQAATQFAANCSSGAGAVLPCSLQNSSGVPSCTTYSAVCPTTSGSATGPFTFINVGSSLFSSQFEALAHTPSNASNGTDILNFAATCTADNGVVCRSAAIIGTGLRQNQCTYSSLLPSANSNTCYNLSLSCLAHGVTGLGCTTNPQYSVIQ